MVQLEGHHAAAGRASTICSATARPRSRSSLGKYVLGRASRRPAIRSCNLATSVTRTWTDANRNFVPDCDLAEPAGQRRVRRDSADLDASAAVLPSTTIRPGDAASAGASAPVQLGVLDQRAARAGAARRRSTSATSAAGIGNFTVTDNRRRRADRLQPVQHHRAARSAAAGRRRLHRSAASTTSTRTRSAQVDNYITFADNYGKQIEHWNGVDAHGERPAAAAASCCRAA